MPEQNARPLPRTIATKTPSSSAARSALSASAAARAVSSALSTAGRSRVIVATPAATS